MDFNDKDTLLPLLKKCKRQDRHCQRKLYKQLYGFAMKICLRYANSKDEAHEIANDGFVKIFTKLDKYNPELSFLGWVRKIMINCAIDHYRKNEFHYHNLEISHAESVKIEPDAIQNSSAEELLKMVNNLPPAYRVVFNLYAIEGYNHREISEKLDISEGTSKSNLAKARMKLKKLLQDKNGLQQYG